MKKLLFILPALLLSSTVQIEAMQSYYNEIPQVIDEINEIMSKIFRGDTSAIHNDTIKDIIINNISRENYITRKTDKDILCDFLIVFGKLPSDKTTPEILLNISRIDEHNLRDLDSILNMLLSSDKVTKDILFNISKSNILYTLNYFLKKEFPLDKATPEILLNITSMDRDTLNKLSSALNRLPLNKITSEILLNLSKMNQDTLDKLRYLLEEELPEEVKTTEILSDISKMNAYALDWTHYMFNKLRLKEIQKETLPNIIKDIIKNKNNNITTLKDINVILSNLQEDGVIKKDLFLNISNNISKMDENTLSNINKMDIKNFYWLCYALDRLPAKETTPQTLFNFSNKISGSKLYNLCKVFENLPEEREIEDILFNLSNMDEDRLYNIYKVLNKLPDSEKIKKVLDNLSKMNKYGLSWMNYMFDKLQLKEIPREILLNIIEEKNNISTLQDINSVLSNLQKNGLINNDLFLNISKNINNADETTLSNIDKFFDVDQLYRLYNVLDKLPSDKTTEGILSNIGKMNDSELYHLYDVLCELPEEGKTKEILTNISKIKDKNILMNLYNNLKILNIDEGKMRILREFGLLQ